MSMCVFVNLNQIKAASVSNRVISHTLDSRLSETISHNCEIYVKKTYTCMKDIVVGVVFATLHFPMQLFAFELKQNGCS